MALTEPAAPSRPLTHYPTEVPVMNHPSPLRPRATLALMLASALLCTAAWAQDVPVTYLYGSGTDAYDEFGWDTALHGDLLLVGADGDLYQNPPNQYLVGRVYVFERTEGGAWEETGLWFPPVTHYYGTEGMGGGGFGQAIALAPGGRLALVGVPYENEGYSPHQIWLGAAYAFRYDEGTGEWEREARLRPSGLEGYAKAGTIVAVAGEIAAMNGGWNGRSLVVFRHTPDADTTWTEEAAFTTGLVSGFFSVAGNENVAVMDHQGEGERVVGGAYWEDTGHGQDAGAVYVYRNDGPEEGPPAWGLEARIEPSDAASGRFFGVAVALSPDGRLLLIGANENGGESGRAYVFRREGAGAASVWVEEAVLTPGTGRYGFGSGAVLSEEPETRKPLALVMHGGGIGELFRQEADGSGGFVWERVVALRDSLQGDSASLDGTTAAAGNILDATLGERAGKAMVFDLAQVVPVEPAPPQQAGALALSAYPNPARGSAALALVLPEPGRVQVALYDVLGRRVALLHEGLLTAGTHRLAADVRGLVAGVYLARAETAAGVVTTRLAVVR